MMSHLHFQKLKYFFIIFFLLVIPTTVYQQEGNDQLLDEYKKMINRLKSKNGKGLRSFNRNRRKFFQNVIRLSRHRFQGEKQSDDIRRTAIKIIEIARSKRAVDTLIKEITFKPSESQQFDHWAKAYPSVQALIRIGKPASKTALKKLSKFQHIKREEVEKRMKLLLYLIKKVEGKELGQFLLEQSLENADNDREKRNYEQSLKWIKKPIKINKN